MKNIPIPPKDNYLKTLISKVESFISRLRWKAHFFLNKDEQNTCQQENYGFKSNIPPPKIKQLTKFEEDMYNLISDIKFNNKRNDFQKKLLKDIKTIKKSDKIYTPADKTTNMYKLSKTEYQKLLHENVTKDYKLSSKEELKSINKEAKTIATKLELEHKIECIAEKDAFITLKDHKENFHNNTKCRLINPAKSEIGKVSSFKLKEINNALRSKLKIEQWQNTTDAIKWFNNIEKNNNNKFFQLDIVEFYPSISEELLDKTIEFASKHINFDNETNKLIKHCRKSILFFDGKIWKKKNNNSLFDVTMGSFDGAEICEFVGIYIIHLVRSKFPMLNFGLYRDDGLGFYNSLPGPTTCRLQKDLIKLFQSLNLRITCDFNLTQINFLDVTMNIKTAKYWPYRKPNDNPLYIHRKSNHPNPIKKELPKMINKRLSSISCNETEFNKCKKEYEDALLNSEFNCKLNFETPISTKKKRKRKIIWFNPPWSESVDTPINKKVLNLVEKHFPKSSILHKIFNKNTIKVSYSCMPNMKTIITKHNKNTMNKDNSTNDKKCNCRSKNNCPLNNECLTEAIIYQATVEADNNSKTYIGSCETPFKTRYYNHTKSFNNEKYKHETKLSSYLWELKEDNINYTIEWKILNKSNNYQCGTRHCNLCLTEKLYIMNYDNNINSQLLNSRSELMTKCRHAAKFKISNIK